MTERSNDSARPRVLITRPGERGLPLARAIAALGAEVEILEVMRQERLAETPQERAVWLNFDQFHKVVVVSPYAASCLVEAVEHYWPQLPLGIEFYAVGAATAEVLHHAWGVKTRIPPPELENTSEALLTLSALQRLDEQRILLVAGEGGRLLLGDTLAQRGARVERLALYRRVLMEPRGVSSECLVTGKYAALIVSSGEILEHLAGWCKKTALNQPLIVSSRRLATLAERLGFVDCHVADGATPAALAIAVARVCDLKGVDHDDLEKG